MKKYKIKFPEQMEQVKKLSYRLNKIREENKTLHQSNAALKQDVKEWITIALIEALFLIVLFAMYSYRLV